MRPRSGARYELQRVEGAEDEAAGSGGDVAGAGANILIYKGFVHLPDARIPVEVRVELPGGDARASLGEGGGEGEASRKEIERLAAAFVRSATKSAATAGSSPPRKIVRWRG